MMELVIISGKGGGGKTSITASLAHLAEQTVIADCDVDAPNLHLLLDPDVQSRKTFWDNKRAVLHAPLCARCGECHWTCRFDAVESPALGTADTFSITSWACEGCGACAAVCPQNAIEMLPEKAGEWFESHTRYGPLVHARLQPGAGNSGKLVATVRRRAREIAVERDLPLVLIDGPPGISCPVIAAITGAGFVLILAEPTISGEHDLQRALELVEHFGFSVGVCINRWDLDERRSAALEEILQQRAVPVLGRISCDPNVGRAREQVLPVTAWTNTGAAAEIHQLWQALRTKVQPFCESK